LVGWFIGPNAPAHICRPDAWLAPQHNGADPMCWPR
jgi:hypothetical protein